MKIKFYIKGLIVFLFGCVSLGFSENPAWWNNRGVLESATSTNDFVAANQGQLMQIATGSFLEFEDRFKNNGGAGEEIRELIYEDYPFYHQHYKAVNAGQLKHTASCSITA